MREVIFPILPLLLLAGWLLSLSLCFIIAVKDLPGWKVWEKRLFWMSAYPVPALLAWLHALLLDPQYRYEYGTTYISLLEADTAGAITALFILLAGIWMAPLFLGRHLQVYLDMVFNEALIILISAYHIYTEIVFYEPAMAVVPLVYTVLHAAFFVRLISTQCIVIRQMRVLYWPALFTLLPMAIYLKLESARKLFYSLPETPPTDCFIVTAASKGHPALVGSWYDPSGKRILNRQLVQFYAFEEKLKLHTPMFHRRLRRVYNRVGPFVARRINRPWKADIAFLLLVPLHILVACLLPFFKKQS